MMMPGTAMFLPRLETNGEQGECRRTPDEFPGNRPDGHAE
jgi:hypothetical protein